MWCSRTVQRENQKNKVDIYQLVIKVQNFVKLCRKLEYPNGLQLPEFIVSMHHWRPVVSFPDKFLVRRGKNTPDHRYLPIPFQ